jgi:hypothetical protein
LLKMAKDDEKCVQNFSLAELGTFERIIIK